MKIRKVAVGNAAEAFIEGNFTNGVNIISSDDNNKGKTIVIQSMMYALGNEPTFPTSFEFQKYYYYIEFEEAGIIFKLCRSGDGFVLKRESTVLIFDNVSELKRYWNRNIFPLPSIAKNQLLRIVDPVLYVQLFFIGQDKKDTSNIANHGFYNKQDFIDMLYAYAGLIAAGYIVRHKLRDRQGRISDTEYVIYEQPQLRKPDTDSPDTENPYMDKPDTEKPAELNIEKSNTQKQNIYGSSTDSIPFRDCAADCLPERKGRDAMSLTEIESYRELIQENIGYEYLCQQYETYREDLDEIVELIVETVCAKRKATRIAGSDFPHEIVRSRFLKLDNSHIEFVMDCLQKNTTEIRNMKQYLLTVLFNAPTTISNHYTSQVNHDLYGGW